MKIIYCARTSIAHFVDDDVRLHAGGAISTNSAARRFIDDI